MAVTNLPANEDTRSDYNNFIINEECNHLPIPEAAANYTKLDMVISVPWCGLADQTVVAGNPFTIHVKEGIRVRSSQIAPGENFNTFGQEVWFDPATGMYYDDEDTGRYLVGYVRDVVNADGVFGFEKRRYVVEGEAT